MALISGLRRSFSGRSSRLPTSWKPWREKTSLDRSRRRRSSRGWHAQLKQGETAVDRFRDAAFDTRGAGGGLQLKARIGLEPGTALDENASGKAGCRGGLHGRRSGRAWWVCRISATHPLANTDARCSACVAGMIPDRGQRPLPQGRPQGKGVPLGGQRAAKRCGVRAFFTAGPPQGKGVPPRGASREAA
jgi:hypothetical protein